MPIVSGVFTAPISMIRSTGTAGITILSIMIPGIIHPGIPRIIPWDGDGVAAGTPHTTAGAGAAVGILHTIIIPGTVPIIPCMDGAIPITPGMATAISGMLIPKITAMDKDVPKIQM